MQCGTVGHLIHTCGETVTGVSLGAACTMFFEPSEQVITWHAPDVQLGEGYGALCVRVLDDGTV